jgi:hypothetical protein
MRPHEIVDHDWLPALCARIPRRDMDSFFVRLRLGAAGIAWRRRAHRRRLNPDTAAGWERDSKSCHDKRDVNELHNYRTI